MSRVNYADINYPIKATPICLYAMDVQTSTDNNTKTDLNTSIVVNVRPNKEYTGRIIVPVRWLDLFQWWGLFKL